MNSVKIAGKTNIKARWKAHLLSNLINKQGTADTNACSLIQQREIREELFVPVTEEELEKALKSTRCGKAPGQDTIQADLWREGDILSKSC